MEFFLKRTILQTQKQGATTVKKKKLKQQLKANHAIRQMMAVGLDSNQQAYQQLARQLAETVTAAGERHKELEDRNAQLGKEIADTVTLNGELVFRNDDLLKIIKDRERYIAGLERNVEDKIREIQKRDRDITELQEGPLTKEIESREVIAENQVASARTYARSQEKQRKELERQAAELREKHGIALLEIADLKIRLEHSETGKGL